MGSYEHARSSALQCMGSHEHTHTISGLRPWTHLSGASVICMAHGTHIGNLDANSSQDASLRSQQTGGFNFKFSTSSMIVDDDTNEDSQEANLSNLLAGVVATHASRGLAAHVELSTRQSGGESATKADVLRCFFCKKTPKDVSVGQLQHPNHHHRHRRHQ